MKREGEVLSPSEKGGWSEDSFMACHGWAWRESGWVFFLGIFVFIAFQPARSFAQTAHLDCAGCHGQTTVATHHAMPEYQQGKCAHCHVGITVTNDCTKCHTKVAALQTTHHNTPEAKKGDCALCHTGVGDLSTCLGCHVSGATRDAHHATVQNQGRKCTDCHLRMQNPVDANVNCFGCHDWRAAVNPHHLATWSVNGDCMYCHRMVWDSTLNAIRTETRLCTDCHSSTTSTTIVVRHHSTSYATSGQCTYCHVGADATFLDCTGCHSDPNRHHALITTQNLACNHCHVTIRLTTTGCASCHTKPIAELHHGTPLQNVGGDCGYCHQGVATPTTCSNCHAANPHHTTTWATSGNCTHCHLRPSWAMDAPKQAACRQCHGPTMHGNGGPIQDFGTCFACHSPKPFHAKPVQQPTYFDATPGKGSFNIFYRQFRKPEHIYQHTEFSEFGQNIIRKDQGHQWRWPAIAFNWATIDHKGMKYTVPTFDGTLQAPRPDSIPTLTIVSPTDGAVASGAISIVASATDGDSIKALYTWMGGFEPVIMQGPNGSITGTWTASWDTARANDGIRLIYVVAIDKAGNTATKEVSVNVVNNGGGTIESNLSICLACHADYRAKVTCNNPRWKDHLIKNRVSLGAYELAEKTYLGAVCPRRGTTPTADLAVCTLCHKSQFDLIDCNSRKWRQHIEKGRVDQTTASAAEMYYLGYTCDWEGASQQAAAMPAELAVCTECHADRSALVDCNNSRWIAHQSKYQNRVPPATYDIAELYYIGHQCGGGYSYDPIISSGGAGINTAGIATLGGSITSIVDLRKCTNCHLDYKTKVNCRNKIWLEHARKNYVGEMTYRAAEITYLGAECGSGITLPTKNRSKKTVR